MSKYRNLYSHPDVPKPFQGNIHESKAECDAAAATELALEPLTRRIKRRKI